MPTREQVLSAPDGTTDHRHAAALSRSGISQAGTASADDPEHPVRPQRERLEARAAQDHRPAAGPRAGARPA